MTDIPKRGSPPNQVTLMFFTPSKWDLIKFINAICVSPSIRERGQVSYGGTVAERASVPVVKAASIHHEQTPPVRTERQILPPISPDKPEERQKTTPTITLAAPRPARPVQNDTAPVIPEVKRAAPVVKESNFTIRRTTARKEWTKTVKTAAKQKKGEKP